MKFIEQHNDWRHTFLNNTYFMFSWIFWVIVLGTLLFLNFQGGLFEYDAYEKADLMKYGFYPVVIW